MNIDGSGLIQLTKWGLNIAVTDWSPDGTKLLWQSSFSSLRGTTTDILIVNVDGSNPVDLTNNSPLAQPPCLMPSATISDEGRFSPDGSQIIFRQTTNACTGQSVLWTMDTNGANKQSTGILVGGPFDSSDGGFPDWGTNQN